MVELASNPFDHQGPLKESAFFFGRANELDYARECIEKHEHVGFVGEPRSGLSSLLNQLMAPEFRAQCERASGPLQLIHVDCVSFGDPLPLARYLLAQAAPGKPIPDMPWGMTFKRFDNAVRQARNTSTVILFDDLELLGRSDPFFQFLETLRGTALAAEMSLITATHVELKQACTSKFGTSPFFNIFRARRLGLLSEEEARALISSAAARGVELTPHAERILALGGRFPCFLQMACSCYYQGLAQGQVPDHAALAQQFMATAETGFDHIWQRLDASERDLLCDLVKGKRVSTNDLRGLVDKGYVANGAIFAASFADYVREREC
jgi:hypothetical protein